MTRDAVGRRVVWTTERRGVWRVVFARRKGGAVRKRPPARGGIRLKNTNVDYYNNSIARRFSYDARALSSERSRLSAGKPHPLVLVFLVNGP